MIMYCKYSKFYLRDHDRGIRNSSEYVKVSEKLTLHCQKCPSLLRRNVPVCSGFSKTINVN